MAVAVGERMTQMTVAREFPILYRVQNKVVRIGTLYVEATLANLYHELVHTALVILVSQGANTSLAALRHLATIARTVNDRDFHEPPREADELDRVVSAFDAMGMRLHCAYLDEREASIEREACRLTASLVMRRSSEFHQFARDGNMRGIIQWAERIAASDPAHAAFAARLHQLARAYQSKAVLQLVERYLEGNTAS
ncbi:hypothetical protein AB4Y32_39395 [Paraburkholderia phymatum]|uniref:Uncharacterized protein n=1 Tax=Paraburkholderia phymatum TaxID=148447 RepID=A0ACC6UDJ2_9BURK